MISRALFSAVVVSATSLAIVRAFPQADAAAGEAVFSQKCASCHTVTPDLAHGLLGPNLTGVVGRTAGTMAGWDFSTALKESKLTWTDETLHKWLTDSMATVPGAKMDLKVPSRI